MVKTFDVVGVPKATLIFRGVALMPRKRVHLTMNEMELKNFSKFLDELEYSEQKLSGPQEEIIVTEEAPIGQKSEPLIEVKEEEPQEIVVEEKEPIKEEKQNDRPNNHRNKTKSKKQI